MPETVVVGRKKQVIKDEWGRIQYTTEVKLDENGNPKWVIAPLDLVVITENIRRYGLWCSEYGTLADVAAPKS